MKQSSIFFSHHTLSNKVRNVIFAVTIKIGMQEKKEKGEKHKTKLSPF